MSNDRPVLRFAPSPNGYLHLGHAYSALFTQRMAQQLNGRLLLRIEDIDLTRARPEFEAALLEDLAWLGFEWERPVRRQSEHFPFYAEYLDRLDEQELIYACFATRREIADAVSSQGETKRDPDGTPIYPGLYRDLPKTASKERIEAGEPYALRLNMARALALATEKNGGPISFRSFTADGLVTCEPALPERWGDVVLARKDSPASYHLAVTADDALQGVTHITRGMDLLDTTGIHRLLQILLKLPEPVYCHHPLIVDETGRKLSKSHRDKSIRSMRAEGLTRNAVIELSGLTGG